MNPQDPQSELHDALLEMGFANKPGSTKGRMYEVVVAEDGTSEERLGKEFIHAVPVSFLEHKKQELEGGVNG